MKGRLFLLTFTSVMLVVGLIGCSQQDKDMDEETRKSSPAESRVKQGADDQIIVTVDTATQKVMGLQVTNLAVSQLYPEVKGYGRVLDASPLAALVTDLTAAQKASDTSTAELKRVKTLAASDNASARALQTAEADAARDRALVESAKQRLLASWGGAIAGRTDLQAFAQFLLTLESALVEISLPAGESLEVTPTGARIALLGRETSPVEAQFIGAMPVVDSQLQGQAFFFLVASNSWRLTPGAAVTGWIRTPGEPIRGVVTPESAIVRYQEKAWVYVATDGTNFARTEIVLEHPLENGWFVTVGLQPGEAVVVSGTQTLLSEELKSLTPVGD